MTKAASRQGGCFLFLQGDIRTRILALAGLFEQQRAAQKAGTGGTEPV